MNASEYRQWWAENTEEPYGHCWCGCGKKTTIAVCNIAPRGWVAGEPIKYFPNHGGAAIKRKNVFADEVFTKEWAVTQAGAWTLGVLMTDGFIGNPYRRVTLSMTDRDVVVQAAKVMGLKEHAVRPVDKGDDKTQYVFAVGMTREQSRQYTALTGLELGPKSGKELTPKCLAQNADFWRGAIDGDGSILLNLPKISFCSSGVKFVEQFQAFLVSLGIKPTSIIVNGGMYVAHVTNARDCLTLLDALYPPGCTWRMQRKYESAQKLRVECERVVLKQDTPYVPPTACQRGHEYVRGSYSITKDGRKYCLVCKAEKRVPINIDLEAADDDFSGVEHGNAKLTEEQVRHAFSQYHEEGHSQERIAKSLGVDRKTIGFIVTGETWQHLGMEVPEKKSEHANARLTEEQVKRLYVEYHVEGRTQKELADELGTNKATIGYIVRGKTWTHLDLPSLLPGHLREKLGAPQAKKKRALTEAEAKEILRRVKAGESQKSLAREFRVSPAAVSMLVAGKTHRHLQAAA